MKCDVVRYVYGGTDTYSVSFLLTDLMRTHFASLLLTLVFLVAATITAITGWRNYKAHLMRSTAILAFVASK